MTDFSELHKKIKRLSKIQGISPVDVLALPDPLGNIIRVLTKNKSMSLKQLADLINLPVDQTEIIFDELISKGYINEIKNEEEDNQERIFEVFYARMRKRNIPLDL